MSSILFIYVVGATTKENYEYIDSNNPQKGLKISFHPFITWENATDSENKEYKKEINYQTIL